MSEQSPWWKVHFIPLEVVLSFLVGAVMVVWCRYFHGGPVVDTMLLNNRAAVYGTLASIFGSLLGFTITAIAIVLSFATSPRLKIIQSSRQYEAFWRVFTLAIRFLGLATVAALVGLVCDRDTAPHHWVLYFCVVTTLLASLHLTFTIVLLEAVVRIVTRPSQARAGDQT